MDDRELLARHLPLLRYDSQAAYRACSAAAITDWPGNSLRRAGGELLAAPPRLRLSTLTAYPEGAGPAPGDYLDEAPDQLEAGRRFASDPAYAERVYGRVRRDRGALWLQYWLFYYYNPHNLLGYARHEGDWEMIQVGLDSAGRPLAASFAQHTFGAALGWDEVERHPPPDGPRPVVYVAPLSNACYPQPGRFPYLGGIDEPNGDGPELTPILEEFAGWELWSGRWGASRGVLGGRLGGRSPQSPGRQPKWLDPSGFHRGVSRPSLGKAIRAFLRFAIGGPRPAAPELSASLREARLTVEFDLIGLRSSLAPRHIYVTAHEPDAPHRVLARRGLRSRLARGRAELHLPSAREKVLVRATAFDARRRRSNVAEVSAETAA